jgi:nicotinamidase/pyrazinamidase
MRLDQKKEGFVIYGTQDWHPANHVSFAVNHPGKKPFEAVQQLLEQFEL